MRLYLINKDLNWRILMSDRVDKIKQHVCGATFAYCSGSKDEEDFVIQLRKDNTMTPALTFELEV